MGEASEDDDQQRLSQLQRKRSDRGRHPDFARSRIAVDAFRVLVPCRLPIVDGKSTNMPAMEANELAKRPHARIVTRRLFCIIFESHRLERSLPEQAIDKRLRRRMIRDEPVVSRERHPETAEVREICQAVA